MKKYLPTFTAAMQNYVKSPSAVTKVSLLFYIQGFSYDYFKGGGSNYPSVKECYGNLINLDFMEGVANASPRMKP